MNEFLNSIAECSIKPRDPIAYKHSIMSENIDRYDTLREKHLIYSINPIVLGYSTKIKHFYDEHFIWNEETDYITGCLAK